MSKAGQGKAAGGRGSKAAHDMGIPEAEVPTNDTKKAERADERQKHIGDEREGIALQRAAVVPHQGPAPQQQQRKHRSLPHHHFTRGRAAAFCH